MTEPARKITGLKVQKKNTQRVNVYLDGEFAFGLRRIVAAWLRIGQELSDEKIAQLKADDAREEAYQRALRALDTRPRSIAEIRQKLLEHDIPEDLADSVIERLKENGTLNDERFAQAWIENRCEFRPRGRRALAYELRQRGVDAQAIDDSLDQLDEASLAVQAASKQARKLQNLEWLDFRKKLTGFLARRGFSYEDSAAAVSQVWSDLHSQTLRAGSSTTLRAGSLSQTMEEDESV
jgi:regulatory protein